MSFYDNHPKFYISADCIIFGYFDNSLHVLIRPREMEPCKGQLSLMGGFVDDDESVDHAAARIVKELTGLQDFYIRQVGAFGNVDRDPGERVVSISYYVLIKAAEYSGEEGWKALCESDDVDLVYICTPWLLHTPVSLYAMEHGKHVACEVPSMMNVRDCWDIINTCEKTRRHFMMLENCCYDFYEMTALNMAQKGVFGEVYHVEGAYIHNLDPFWKAYQGNWRLEYNQKFRGDNYPTHGIGPVCQVLNIHRGDRMNVLVAMDTKPLHGAEVARENMGVEEFANGDHTVSLIRTEKGHQIEIHHNVYAARPYSRMYQLTGDKGFANKYPVEGFSIEREALPEAIRDKEVYSTVTTHELSTPEMMAAFDQDFKHPVIAQNEEMAAVVGGHGGMDYIMDARLIYCLNNGLPLDMDVYDAAEWSCIRELSEVSIKNGSMPVEVPDFTRGGWNVLDGVHHAFK